MRMSTTERYQGTALSLSGSRLGSSALSVVETRQAKPEIQNADTAFAPCHSW